MKKGWVWLIVAGVVVYIAQSPAEAGETFKALFLSVGQLVGKFATFIGSLVG